MPVQPFTNPERTDMKKRLIIEDHAKFITFRNRKVRTPVTLEVSDSDLKAMLIHMRMSDIKNWRVEDIKDEKTEVIDYDYAEPNEVIIEELEDDEPSTILEKLMKSGESES